MKICSVCKKEVDRLKVSEPPICVRCYNKSRPPKKGTCSICNRFMSVHEDRKTGNLVCGPCRNKQYERPVDICSVCNKLREVSVNKETKKFICDTCSDRQYQQSRKKKEICSICGKNKKVKSRQDGKPVCMLCYKQYFQPKEECSVCGKLRTINGRTIDGKVLCNSCYEAPKEICCICKEIKPVYKRINETESVCGSCYSPWRKSFDNAYAISQRLRCRLRGAFNDFATLGMTRSPDEYGINYQEIIEYLGKCPGNLKDYHIDHIKPLSLFDFDDLEQIRLAFKPENHQWLLKEENLKKSNKYAGE